MPPRTLPQRRDVHAVVWTHTWVAKSRRRRLIYGHGLMRSFRLSVARSQSACCTPYTASGCDLPHTPGTLSEPNNLFVSQGLDTASPWTVFPTPPMSVAPFPRLVRLRLYSSLLSRAGLVDVPAAPRASKKRILPFFDGNYGLFFF